MGRIWALGGADFNTVTGVSQRVGESGRDSNPSYAYDRVFVILCEELGGCSESKNGRD